MEQAGVFAPGGAAGILGWSPGQNPEGEKLELSGRRLALCSITTDRQDTAGWLGRADQGAQGFLLREEWLSLVPLYLTRYGGERRHRLSESGSKPNVTALEHSYYV